MPPALQPQTETITLEQYEALPENRRAEVFDGVVYDMGSPSQIHQTLSMELSYIFYNYIKRSSRREIRLNFPTSHTTVRTVRYTAVQST